MSVLFEPYNFCGITLKNRLVRSATMENMATLQKSPSQSLLNLYEELARGGVGLIISSSVRPDRRWDPSDACKNMCIDNDDVIPAFTELTKRIHAFEGKVAIQLGSFFRYEGELVAPSAVPYLDSPDRRPRPLKLDEIKRIVKKYGEAGYRANEAGFDAIQINVAHGFPLCRFLSPYFNRRIDEYGGSVKNRSRIVIEIIHEIQKQAGNDSPLFIKMNVADFCEGGMTVNDAVEMVGVLSEQGVSAIETSGGGSGHDVTWLGPTDPAQWIEGYFTKYAAAIKAEVTVPVILVGGLRDAFAMEDCVLKSQADLVAMSRPFIREPQIVRRWMDGDTRPAECISCDGCFDAVRMGESVCCVTE